MLSFENLNVSQEIKDVLMKYHVDFVFQPIFSREGYIIGHEALMRPEGKDIMDFIAEMKEKNQLHELELLTFFGAAQAYKERGMNAMLSVNSFPAEVFSRQEALEYSLCFRPIKDRLIIEILEFTEEKHWTWKAKREHIAIFGDIDVALDDFGEGNNDFRAVKYYHPEIVKLDRKLVCNVDKDLEKQRVLNDLIKSLHQNVIEVLAEGVETKEEYDYCMAAGVDYFQGFYLGRPQ